MLRLLRGMTGWNRLPATAQRPRAPQQGSGDGCGIYVAYFASWKLRERLGRSEAWGFSGREEAAWRTGLRDFAETLQPWVPASATASGRRAPRQAPTGGTPPTGTSARKPQPDLSTTAWTQETYTAEDLKGFSLKTLIALCRALGCGAAGGPAGTTGPPLKRSSRAD